MNASLVLEDGSVYTGESFGFEKNVSGEVVFTTGMVGYPESMTDPSYEGQILVFTYPLIGNYGVPNGDLQDNMLRHFESDMIHTKAIVVGDYPHKHHHWEAFHSLGDWLKKEKIPGISGIDTRALTKKLREHGTLLGKIVFNDDLDHPLALEDPNKKNLVSEVSCKDVKRYGSGDIHIILLDCGCKNNIIRSFVSRGVEVARVPYDHDFSNERFDGLFISNGPGDPRMCVTTIERIRTAMERNIPTFGICLGNQLLALAAGASTYKLKYGHRSQNQPCLEVGTKRCYITSQNHGYAVDAKTLPPEWEEWFVNANDGTNEGIRHRSKPFFSVQFHPEAMPGPVDTAWLFDKFIEGVKKAKAGRI
ncbi:MAG TPA: glutamine-hydrolyzing carbamoyl-phosphate synthase small subunit [Candidatus Nanoarchaeia archaeon]|nr:glutamine-hydrolyzing carbamoyl-phosphate synthase small subunit [Candidatus Nanoarchaeia archaeon]